MFRATLTWAVLAACAHGQLAFPPTSRPGLPAPAQAATANAVNPDSNAWVGPLAAIPGETEVYRTFAGGSLTPLHSEISPQSTLVGFEITTQPFGRSTQITSLQAFYTSAAGRYPGTSFGNPIGARTKIIARDGYAVRALGCGTAGPASGLQVTFGRIQPDGTLSASDVYSSPAYGAGFQTLDAAGIPVCGIAVNGQNHLSGMALLIAQSSVQRLMPSLVPVARGGQATSIASRSTPPSVAAAPSPQPPLGNFNPAAYPTNPIATTASPIPGLPPIASPATAAAPASKDLSSDARLGELVRSAGENLVFVESKDGQGSGFLCKLNGKRVLLTNQHVIAGNPNVRFTTLTQTEIKAGAARAAAAHDLISYDVPDALSSLETVPDFAQSVLVGDEVVVLGNTEGARVIKPLLGRVVAVGPDLVEISSEFLPGNSGSPIVHLKSNKVIGIATYAIVRKVNSLSGANEPSIRRFGYRLDSVQNWQPVNWPAYQAEALAAKKISDFSTAIIQLLVDVRGGRFDPSRHTDSRLKPAVGQLATLITRRNMNQIDRVRLVHNFLGELRNVAQRDVEDLRPRLRYDYFQRELAEEGKFRLDIHTGLGEAIQKLR